MIAPTFPHSNSPGSTAQKRHEFRKCATGAAEVNAVTLAFALVLGSPALAQLVEPEQWEPPIVNMAFSPIEWSAVPMTLDNLRIQDAADDIGFDLLRLDNTFGASPGSVASAPFSVSPGQPPDEEALIVASNDGIYLAENTAVFGYTALESGNRILPAAPADPRRVIVVDLNGDGVNDTVDVPRDAAGLLRLHLGANLGEEITLSLPGPSVDVVAVGNNLLAVLGTDAVWLIALSGSPGFYSFNIQDTALLAPVAGTSSIAARRLASFTLGSGETALAAFGSSVLSGEGAKVALFKVDVPAGGGIATLLAGGNRTVGFQTYSGVDIAALNVGMPAQGLVMALANGLTEGALEFLQVATDAQGLPQPSALFIGNIENIELDSFPSALAVADFSPTQDGIDDIVVGAIDAGKKQPLLIAFEALAVANYETVGETVWAGDESISLPLEVITQLTVAHLNDDNIPNIPDLAATLPDYQGGVVAIFRARPPPCAVAVTTPVHGHMGALSAFPFIAWPLAVKEISEFNAAGKERVRGQTSIMNGRRPQHIPFNIGDPNFRELCPIGHVAVDGRWENLTTLGGLSNFIGRGAWLGAWGIPGNHQGPPFFGSPKAFWALEIPIAILERLQPPPLSIPAETRLSLVALGASVELLARVRAGRGSRIAAANIAAAVDEAVSRARAAMDPCAGVIFYDSIGHSRGSPQISSAAKLLSGTTRDALDHNTLASLIYIDAIDPFTDEPGFSDNQFGIYGDALRPWAHSGSFH